ncbi:MAG: metallophosphoesterase [Thiohalocapsa sp.]
MSKSKRTISASVLALTLGHASQSGATEPLAAYVLLGQTAAGKQIALARVVIDQPNASCPSLEPFAEDGEGSVRAMQPRRSPNPDNFPVTVCEAVYPRDGSSLRISGSELKLPRVPAKPSRIAVIGDTGCKPKYQHSCKGNAHWPFREMADSAAGTEPDLVLHMGDYNYRGTPGKIDIREQTGKVKKVHVYDAGDNAPGVTCTLAGPYYGQNSPGSETPDSWKAWKKDFFEPGARLLSAAPWVLARGNHELCSRAGPGWFYFLDPGTDLLDGGSGQLACPPAESPEPVIFREPYRVDLGGLSLILLDSANACDQGDLHQKHFDAQFARIQTLVGEAPAGNAIWLQSHRPLWGLNKPRGGEAKSALDTSGRYAVIDRTLQTALAAYPLPKPIHLVLSGHMHLFQSIDFKPPSVLPTQLILGNGGVELDDNAIEGAVSAQIRGADAVGFGSGTFGWMEIRLNDGGQWSSRMFDRKGSTLVRCDSARMSGTGACEPIGH